MKPNAFFNLNRFVALIRQDLLLNRSMYLLMMVVSFGAIYLGLIYQMNLQQYGFIEPVENLNFGRDLGWGYSDFFLFTLLGLAVFIGLSFSNLGSKPKVTRLLMMPASTFEKYVYPFVFRVVVGVLYFAFVFWVDAQLARWTMQGSEKFVLKHYVIVPFDFSMLLNFSRTTVDNLLILSAVFASGIFAFVVPLFFKKQALLKSVLAYFGLIFAYACCLVLFSHLFIPATKGFDVTLRDYQITEHLSNIILMFLVLLNMSWVFLLFIGYFKLKEKRV